MTQTRRVAGARSGALVPGCALALALAAAPALAQDTVNGQITDAATPDPAMEELRALRAEGDIRELLHAYGRTIDARDFDAFAELWAEGAVYLGGPGGAPVSGGPAIAAFMENIIGDNPSGFKEPNYHIFFNEHIDVAGDAARGTSMSAFVVPGEDGWPVMSILAMYEDEYVLEDGTWKFARRAVRGAIPGRANGSD